MCYSITLPTFFEYFHVWAKQPKDSRRKMITGMTTMMVIIIIIIITIMVMVIATAAIIYVTKKAGLCMSVSVCLSLSL
jgi:maltodextrin utilization protein YvdJ